MVYKTPNEEKPINRIFDVYGHSNILPSMPNSKIAKETRKGIFKIFLSVDIAVVFKLDGFNVRTKPFHNTNDIMHSLLQIMLD